LLKKAFYDTNSEAYSRIAVDYLIVTCMVKYKNILSKEFPTDDPTAATAPIPKQFQRPTDDAHDQTIIAPVHDEATEVARPSITPTTPLIAPKSTSEPLPFIVFPEMPMSVLVKSGGQVWRVSEIADWAIGCGSRALLEDGTVLLAIEAKWPTTFFQAQSQLLVYLAVIRQLRIQANKTNVMT
jgi:hypothetical protein